MAKKPPDKKADIKGAGKQAKTAADRGSGAADREESIGLMEPLLISEGSRHRGAIADLVVELTRQSAAFKASLPDGIATALATLVRAMNCYYSNLIEGHNTHPVDIERALNDDFSGDRHKRNLQLEAKAHIAVQTWIDGGGLGVPATGQEAIKDIHRRFCELMPAELRVVDDPATGRKIRIVPGELRQRDVQVGRHRAISPGAVPRFMVRFEAAYAKLGALDRVLATAAAHHRLLWVHPFLDGNGRVARLMSHAMLKDALDTGALWSVARGLARSEALYKQHLAACDMPRRNDLDGRGTLSEEALADFTSYFLNVCLDQVSFMRELVQPERLRARIGLWAEEQSRLGLLPPKSAQVLEAVLYRGELARADIPALLGTGERQARRVTAELLAAGVLTSASAKSPMKLAFPATLAGRWMPGLFPEQT